MYTIGRGKMWYITSETKAPKSTDLAYATWDAEKSMVMTWLCKLNGGRYQFQLYVLFNNTKSYGKTSIICTMILEINLKFSS